jgi:hypothetical protein
MAATILLRAALSIMDGYSTILLLRWELSVIFPELCYHDVSERISPMTVVQTLREMKGERLTNNFAPQERIETEKPKTPMEWYDQFCREFIE